MMMHAVGEEKALGIYQKVLIFSALRINPFRLQDGFHGVTDPEVLLAVLVPEDVPSVLGGFGQVVGILLLPQAQVFPAGNPVPHDLEVCKSVNGIFEIFFPGLASGCIAGGDYCRHPNNHHHDRNTFHSSISVYANL